MKSILFVLHKMNLGGTEKALLSLLDVMKTKPVTITILLLEKGGALKFHLPPFVYVKYLTDFEKMKPMIEDPPHHTLLKFFKSFQFAAAFQFLITYCKIKISGDWYHNYEEVLKRSPNFGIYDVAIAFAGPSDFITYFVEKKVTAKKKIQWIHFDIEKVITNFNFGRKFYPFYDQIFCVSKSSKDIFVKHFPQFENKTDVFHNIVSAPEIIKLAENGDSFIDDFQGIKILTVGRFTIEKGQHLIPDVAAKLKSDQLDFRWYLVGDGKQKAIVEKMTAELELSEEIIFLGEKENPYSYMRDCDLYVQPSLHEGFGITIEEAKVFNKPIVVTNFASAIDLIENRKTGLITDISSEAIYKSVKTLIINKDLRNKFSENLKNRELLINYDFNQIFN